MRSVFKKFESFGFNGLLFAEFRYFISGHSIILVAKHRGFESAKFVIPLVVPQVDNLSTLFFNIFINDVFRVIQSSQVYLFVDVGVNL